MGDRGVGFMTYSEHQRWAHTPEGQAEIAKYPRVAPRSADSERAHREFAQRVLAKYAVKGRNEFHG